MSQADQAPPAASTTPGDEKQPLLALTKALLDEERLRLFMAFCSGRLASTVAWPRRKQTRLRQPSQTF